MNEILLKRDQELKRAVGENTPEFDWYSAVQEHADLIDDYEIEDNNLKLPNPDGEYILSLAELSKQIGDALTTWHIALQKDDIFNQENQAFVADVVQGVLQTVTELREKGSDNFSQTQLKQIIERVLVENKALDVATSFILRDALMNSSKSELASVRIIRRNRQIVPWNTSKIEVAIRKAFLAIGQDSAPAVDISNTVKARVRDLKQTYLHIEDIQDIVQEEIMKAGHFKVAEAYILYRANRSMNREKKEPEKTDDQLTMIVVKRSDDSTYFWDGKDLRERIRYAMIDLDLAMSEEQIEADLRRSVFNEISQEDLNKTIILNAKTLIERDADFARFAGRLLLTFIYEEVLDWDIWVDGIGGLKEAHKRALKNHIKHGVRINRLNPQLLDYDFDKLGAALDPSSDLSFDYLGVQTMYDRYLIVDKTRKKHRRIETPQLFWMRVSMGLFLNEKNNAEDRIIELYNLYKSRRFCSSTPTLFNSGTVHSQLSSCYLYWVDDSIEGIMQRGIAENAYLAKWAGGLGGSWTSVRGTGSHIRGTNGESQGVIPFLKLHNDQLIAVNQGGKRKGSGCAYLETWHSDIFEFLELRKNTGDDRRRTHDMNTANWIPDLFMKRMEARENWTLFRSNEVPDLHHTYGKRFEEKYMHYEAQVKDGKIYGESIPALDLWKKMLSLLFETGHPWITFKDACNVRSPQDHVGVIHSSNLCTEITLNTGPDETAVCNLGSVVIENHLDEAGNIDHKKLRETIRVAIRALDNVIDLNFYPTEAAKRSNQRHRPIGMGLMGMQNALYKKQIAFQSNEAIEFNDEMMEAIAYYAYEASSDLAEEQGTYSSYKGSKWDRGLMPQDTLEMLEQERGIDIDVPKGGKMDWQPLRDKIAKQGMRNSNVLAIAPTATISNIMGTSPCIEPTYKNLYVKSNLSGEFIVLNAYLVKELKALNLWDDDMIDNLKYFDGELSDIERIPQDIKDRYATAFDVGFEAVIESASRRQKWIDQSQSVNLWLNKPDMKTLSHMYRGAWSKGLKTTYYLRTLGASNIEKATVSVKKEMAHEDVQNIPAPATDVSGPACSILDPDCESCQ